MPKREGLAHAERLVALERLLLEQPGRKWRTHELADEFDVSDDTIARDLEKLSGGGNVPLFRNGTTAGATWEVAAESRAVLPPLRLDYAQGAALYAAARLLSQQYDERNEAVRTAMVQLIGVLPEPLRPHLESIVTGLGRSGGARAEVSGVFAALSQGWLNRRVVRLRYEPAGRTGAYTCRFAPYLLEPIGIGYTLYFIGWSDPPGALRTYKLERVRHAELTDESFEIPADFDGPGMLLRAWGVMYGEGDPVHVKLRFSPAVRKRVRETRWHASEALSDTAEGLTWEADIGDVTEMRPWIRGWGADCEVLEPAELREEMMREARRLGRLYGVTLPTAAGTGPDQTLLDDLFGEE